MVSNGIKKDMIKKFKSIRWSQLVSVLSDLKIHINHLFVCVDERILPSYRVDIYSYTLLTVVNMHTGTGGM